MVEPSGQPPPAGLLGGLARRVGAALESLDEEALREREATPGYDSGPTVAFVVGAVCLVLMEYLAGPRVLSQLLYDLHASLPELCPDPAELRYSRWFALLDLGFWVATRALGFVLIPALATRFLLRRPLRDLGLRAPDQLADLKPYAGLFALVLPLLVLAALRPEFRSYYPFYRRAAESWFDLLVWEGMYAFQFFCVEFFFRGFLLAAAKKSLGSHAVSAALVPYCMVHFSKPFLEVLGAIPAGFVLGVLALRTRSIWGGVVLHVAVAWTMDCLAIAQTSGFPTRVWP